MCPNINIKHGIQTIKEWLEDPTIDTTDIPKDFILKALNLCMKENHFSFGNLLFLQIDGTAMGTPCAVVYANSYTGRPERTKMTNEFKNNLAFTGRFTDDMVGIWRHNEKHNKFDTFVKEMNSTTSLKWTVEGPTESLIFMNLNIESMEKEN